MYLRDFQPAQESTNITFAFKCQLDKYLALIPDQPTIYGLPRAANSNSLLDQTNYKNTVS